MQKIMDAMEEITILHLTTLLSTALNLGKIIHMMLRVVKQEHVNMTKPKLLQK